MLRAFLLSAALIFLSGCIAMGVNSPKYAVVIKNADWSLQDLQNLVAAVVPTGLRSTSSNGREFYSKYFVIDGPKYKLAGDSLERFTATVTVLGDSRPYDIEIYVTKEKRVLRENGFDYVAVGHSTLLAKEIEYRLKTELAKHREDRNIIDDFRVF